MPHHDRYRAAIIGLGFIGAGDQVSGDALGQRVEDLDGTHAGALSRNSRVELIAGSSRDAGRRERFAARSGARTYADWREMLAAERPAIVSVATYAPTHAEITVACAQAGARAVFCEKPIATRLADAQRMAAACRPSSAAPGNPGTLLAVNHNRRYAANYRRLRDLVAAGGLGELTSVNLQWGSGRLGNVGTHLIDAARMLTGREVAAVSGTLDLSARPDCRGSDFHDPGGWGLLRMDDGLIVTVDAADYAAVPATLTLNGTAGRAITGDASVRIERWDGRVEHWPAPPGDQSSMDVAIAEIVRYLDDGTPFPCSADESVRTLEAIIAFHASHDRGAAWVPLPLTGVDREREVRSG
jgi:UDP-N-acetylglucosamine 3-dehydrogenase